ncbi:chromosomal replication initiator protein DnaA, partial [Candidatus Woesebacteria bacterium]|nr:chromosomal replication initiator protein DnaA [Candidatus Woesebacteria bacterium]
TWILANPITQVAYQENGPVVITISSPTSFHSTNLQKNFSVHIKQVLESVVEKPCQLRFRVGEAIDTIDQDAEGNQHLNQASSFNPTASFVSPIAQPQKQSPPRSRSIQSPNAEELFSEHALSSAAEDRLLSVARGVGLRLDYTFDTFAVSTTNEMAHAAASAVAQRPGQSYNPLFFYGGVGVGKTHLMHAIGHIILREKQNVKIIYCTGEEFTNDIVHAIQTKRASQFKDRYRSADVLLIDDIQFIAGKNAVQEEFFHTFNALTKMQKQVVLTSDRPPHEITLLEDRLRSRFEAGLMIDIQQPSFELRTAIVLVKAKAQYLSIPMNLAKEIAAHIESARKIEGIIAAIRSEVELKGKQITAELISSLVEHEQPSERRISASASDVIKAVAAHFHLTQSSLKGKSRLKHLVTARHLTMFVMKQELSMPLVEIGRWFSGRDHTSVIHAVRKVDKDLKNSIQLQQDLSAIKTTLSAK